MTTEKSKEKAIVPAPKVELGTIAARTPAELVQSAATAADALAGVVRDKGLAVRIQGREFVRCEGWTTLAAMVGVVPREEEVRVTPDGKRYVATVALVRVADGAVITRASAECGSDEKRWRDAPRYARRSMAVTRATSKACRLAFSWVMTLAGYEATPAEEVPDVQVEPTDSSSPSTSLPPRQKNSSGSSRTISRAQAKRLWARAYAIADAHNVGKEAAKKAVVRLLESRGFKTSTDVPMDAYDEIVQAAEDAVQLLAARPGEVIEEFENDSEAPF